MFRIGIVLALVAIVASVSVSADDGYDGFKIFEVLPKTQEQIDFLHELSNKAALYDFFILRRVTNQPAQVMVNRYEVQNFLDALNHYNITFRILNENVGCSLENEFANKRLSRNWESFTGKGSLNTDRYYIHDEINNYIEDLAERYPSRVIVKTVGKSFMGRTIKTITISNGDGRSDKNVIFIDGGFHAREWISPAAVLYVIDRLVENFEENAELLLDYDFLILPVVNPDGYEYTQISPKTRFWRKTRQAFETDGKICYGTDPNRNFGFHWNEQGASSNPCDEIYAGPTSFSEPETIIVRDLIHSLKRRGIMYLSVHSYGNYLIYPWGWTTDLPDNVEDLDEIANIGADAIFEATGIEYTTGTAANAFYISAGCSDDYAYNAGFKIAITMELSGGGTGFDPPTTSIDRMVKEAWVGIRAMTKRVVEKYSHEYIDFL